MKNKKILALLATTVLSTAFVLPLAACGNKDDETTEEPFKISNYIEEYTDTSTYDKAGLSTVKTLTVQSESELTTYKKAFVSNKSSVVVREEETTDGSTVYTLYNVVKGAAVNSAKYVNEPELLDDGFSIRITDSDGKLSVIDLNGNTIIAADSYVSIDVEVLDGYDIYVNNIENPQTVVKYTLTKSVEGEAVTTYKYAYAECTFPKENDLTTKVYTGKLVETSVDKLSVVDPEDEVDYDGTEPVYEDEDITGDIADYRYKEENNTYKFYKDGEKTGEVALAPVSALLENYLGFDGAIGFIGNDFYYADTTIVDSSAAEGYNLVIDYYGNQYKFNITYHKYNIISNETTDYSCDGYLLHDIVSLYNYSTNTVDAGFVYALKLENGVATVPNYVESKLIVDSTGALVQDVTTSEALSNLYYLRKLDDTHYYYEYNEYNKYIYDADFNKIMSVDSVLPDSKLVYSKGRYYDYDGKLVISTAYSDGSGNGSIVTLYGGTGMFEDSKAAALGEELDKYVFITGTTKKTVSDYISGDYDSFAISPRNGYFVVKTVDSTATKNANTYKVYNYAGKLLLTVSGNSITTAGSSKDVDENEVVFLAVTSTDSNDATVTTYYQLSK
jgi:hypothetical protein